MKFLKRLIPFRKRDPQVSVIRLSGIIGSAGNFNRGLNLKSVESNIEAAFDQKNASAVALIINSPGGSPVQADLIQKRIRDLADEKDKPVFVFCEDVAASGGYWIALAANEIYANASSIIGSIGVVSAGFGFTEAISKIGVERRIYSTGDKKGMLDPFQPENSDHVAHLKSLQGEIFHLFQDWVKSRRGAKLKGSSEELFSGAFWTGIKAKELGLIDGLGDMRTIMRERFGENVKFKIFEKKAGFLSRFGLSGKMESGSPSALIDNFLDGIEARALWNRFGL